MLGSWHAGKAADRHGNFLCTTRDHYLVISADGKTADEYASNGFSYSLQYYELLLQHPDPGGLAVRWVPTTLPSPARTRI